MMRLQFAPSKSAFVNVPVILILIGTLFLSCKTAPSIPAKVEIPGAIEQADRLAYEIFKKEDFPGMAVQVWHDGHTVFSKSYGYANVEQKVEIDPDKSLFRIGSISKPYTATALGILFQEGKINLDVPIQTYVPGFPKKKYDITLRQLAGHLAGIRHYRGAEFINDKYYATVDEGLEIFKNDTLIHPPNSKYSYSSYGWNLISAAIEGASGVPFLQFMQEQVFDAIPLKNTMPDVNKNANEYRVSFYQKNLSGENVIAPEVDNSYKWAGGGFISSAADVVAFAKAHLDNEILTKETMEIWTSGQITIDGKNTNYGIGWRSAEDKKGRNWIGHSGGSVGGTSMMLIYPEQRLIVVTAVNLSSAKMGNLAFRIANQFL